jgi:hypothetical protein
MDLIVEVAFHGLFIFLLNPCTVFFIDSQRNLLSIFFFEYVLNCSIEIVQIFTSEYFAILAQSQKTPAFLGSYPNRDETPENISREVFEMFLVQQCQK